MTPDEEEDPFGGTAFGDAPFGPRPSTGVAEEIFADKWFAPLSEPVRRKLQLRAESQRAFAFNPQPFVAGPENWRQPLGEHVRTRRLPVSDYPFLSFVQVIPAENVKLDWWAPASEPVRFKRLSAGHHQSLVWSDFTPAPPADSWFKLLSEPVRFRPQLKSTQQALAFTALTPIPDTTVDKYFAAFSEPIKFRPQLKVGQQQALAWGYFAPVVAEDVTLDKWYEKLSEPVRFRSLAIANQVSLVWSNFTPSPPMDSWFQALREPVQFRSQLKATQLAFLFVKTIDAENVKLDWWKQLSEPVRLPSRITTLRSALTWFNYPVEAVPEVLTLDKWYRPLSEPVRFPRQVFSASQRALAFNPQPFVAWDWYRPLSEPVRYPRQLLASSQQALAFDTQPFVPWGWYWTLSEPTRLGGLKTAYQQALAYGNFVFIAETVTVDKWFRLADEPVRFRPQLRTALQQYFAFDRFIDIPVFNRWFQPLSEPVRPKRGLLPGSQRAFVFNPRPFVPLPDAYWQRLSEPVRIRQLPTALHPALARTDLVFKAGSGSEFNWWPNLSEPSRFPRQLGAYAQRAFFWSTFTPPPPPAPPRPRIQTTVRFEPFVQRVATQDAAIERVLDPFVDRVATQDAAVERKSEDKSRRKSEQACLPLPTKRICDD